MNRIDSSVELEQLEREVERAAGPAARAEDHLARDLPVVGDEVRDALDRNVLARDQDERAGRDLVTGEKSRSMS